MPKWRDTWYSCRTRPEPTTAKMLNLLWGHIFSLGWQMPAISNWGQTASWHCHQWVTFIFWWQPFCSLYLGPAQGQFWSYCYSCFEFFSMDYNLKTCEIVFWISLCWLLTAMEPGILSTGAKQPRPSSQIKRADSADQHYHVSAQADDAVVVLGPDGKLRLLQRILLSSMSLMIWKHMPFRDLNRSQLNYFSMDIYDRQ